MEGVLISGLRDTTSSKTVYCANTRPKKNKYQNVSVLTLSNSWFVDIIFLKGLYFEKIKDSNGIFGFSLYHDTNNFRKRILFHKDEKVID